MSIEEIDIFWACGISQGVLDISMVLWRIAHKFCRVFDTRADWTWYIPLRRSVFKIQVYSVRLPVLTGDNFRASPPKVIFGRRATQIRTVKSKRKGITLPEADLAF
jgi:hypothetical protein